MDSRKHLEFLTYVLSCAVSKKTVDSIPDGIDESILFDLCKFHNLENIVYLTIGKLLSEPIRETLDGIYNKQLFIKATQEYYLDNILGEFEEKGIDYLILKGRELSKLYPSEDMRTSSDFDIYIGKDNCQKARDIMIESGFDIMTYNDDDDDHDEYIAEKFVICELHRVLIQANHPWQAECNQMTNRLILEDGTKHCYKLSYEDFYAYNLAHAAKHMKFSGVGIRVFLDQWLIDKFYGEKMDKDKLNDILKKCNLLEFDKNARELIGYWFEGKTPENPDKIYEMADYVAKSGWVGTEEQFKATAVAENAGVTSSKKVAKLKMCLDILLSPYETMVARYPILEKHKWLTPLCRIHRGFTAVFFKRDLIKNVTSQHDDADMDLGKKIVKFKSSIGL